MNARKLILAFGAMVLSAEADTNAQSAAKTAEKPKAARCEPATGSYLCKSTAPMRVYTREDLQRTGVFDTSAALRKMDPTFR